MKDSNGLELLADDIGTYKGILFDPAGDYFAVAPVKYTANGVTSNYIIGSYDDIRDAAHVGQTFAKKYDKPEIQAMVTSGEFPLYTSEFRGKVIMPKWAFPSVGSYSDDRYDYVKQYVANPSSALMEAWEMFDRDAKIVSRDIDSTMKALKKIEAMFTSGIHLRQAARSLFGVA